MVYILTKKDSPLVLFSGSKVKEQLNFEVRLNVKGLQYYVFYSTLHFLFSNFMQGPRSFGSQSL